MTNIIFFLPETKQNMKKTQIDVAVLLDGEKQSEKKKMTTKVANVDFQRLLRTQMEC